MPEFKKLANPDPQQQKALDFLKMMSGCTTEEVRFVLDIIKLLIDTNTIVIEEPAILDR